VTATLAGGRGALVVLPDGRDVARVGAALTELLGEGSHVVLTADLGPAERYRRWLAVRRGATRAVIGTRAAMFAPVHDLGLAVVWDDGDDLHSEPHAPYPHVREVLGLRAVREGCGLLVGGFARTAEAAQLVGTGWARAVQADRSVLRAAAPRVLVAGDDAEQAADPAARTARLPSLAWRTARDALTRGPVLVQVPRGGYLPSLACAHCRTPARCRVCQGPLATTAHQGTPTCAWCGDRAVGWECAGCGGVRTRALVVGARRTAEELGRAFPQVPVRTSGRDGVLAEVGPEPALVIATPGAEPVAASGYAAALLLDGWALLTRPDLRAGEEALRRWLAAAALVRPAGERGLVVVLADPASRPVQALVRWDPEGFAERELADRLVSRLPPAARMASLTGARPALARLLEITELPPGAEVLGPVAAPGRDTDDGPLERMIVRVPRAGGRALAEALHAAAGVRSARKELGSVRVQVDPLQIT
jgi:primosomal protein N' (replication factor Y)